MIAVVERNGKRRAFAGVVLPGADSYVAGGTGSEVLGGSGGGGGDEGDDGCGDEGLHFDGGGSD